MSRAPEVPTVEELIEKVRHLEQRPLAFQALWDGDTSGWMVCLGVVYAVGERYVAPDLVALRFGGDIRLFQGAVPPWPEARVASELGEALARHFEVPFWFPSPNEPDNDCPSWWEQDRAHACEGCGKLILPHDTPHLLPEVCYNCYLRRRQQS